MDDFDLATQNTINHYRNKLHDIHTWHQQLNDTMTTITSHTMNLAPTTHTPTPKLPGGDALAMLAPYNTNATEPDDLPHPTQILTNHAHTIDHLQQRTPTTYTLTTALRRNHDAIPWLHKHGHLHKWATEINQLWTRLGKITGNLQPNPQPQWTGHITDYADQIPDNTKLTLKEADHFWPGIHNRIRTQKSRGRTTPTPDTQGRYTAADLRNYHNTKGHER